MMSPKAHKRRLIAITMVASWISLIGGCSTNEMAPRPAPTAHPPEYLRVSHPAGYEISDLTALFLDKSAISADAIKDCDADYVKLLSLTDSLEERKQGARELVRSNPVLYHWCFYGKIHELERRLKSETFFDERQKDVVGTYQSLVPIARGFMTEFNDSRYIRWAVRHYRRISAWMFYRKLELSPQSTLELVEASNPFGAWRDIDAKYSVLEKYHLSDRQREISSAPPTAPLDRTPATEPVNGGE